MASPRSTTLSVSKPTDVVKNPDAVRAMLLSAGFDASLVDREKEKLALQGGRASTMSSTVNTGPPPLAVELQALERRATYGGGFNADHACCLWFWDVVFALAPSDLQAFAALLSATSKGKLPEKFVIVKDTGSQIELSRDPVSPSRYINCV